MKLLIEFVDDEDCLWFIELIQRLGLEPQLKPPMNIKILSEGEE